MREMRMRPRGRPVWPRSAPANFTARRRAERRTVALLTAGRTVAPPCVPGVGCATPSSRRASACQVTKVSLSCELISCCS